MAKSMFYNWRKIEGYHCPIIIVLGPRGVGKTFAKVLACFAKFIFKGKRFVYVVETKEMVQTLSQNKGEKFFASIIKYLRENPSRKHDEMLKWLDNSEVSEGSALNKIQGGTIHINGQTAGYIVAINDFANLKRNNFVDMGTILIDEFIPETIDVRHLQMARKIVSLVQSIARRDDVKIYMLGNTIRLNDIILSKLGIDNLKTGEFRVIKDKYGPLIVANLVDPRDYEEFMEESDKSVAGRFATILKEDNLDKNVFKGELDENLLIPGRPKASHLMFCLHGEAGSVRINTTKDHSEYYVFTDYGVNTNNRICFDSKYITPVVAFNDAWKEILVDRYSRGLIKFESSAIHVLFKSLLNLDTNT